MQNACAVWRRHLFTVKLLPLFAAVTQPVTGGHSACDRGHSARGGACFRYSFTILVAPLPKGSWHATA